jgi:transcriptional regulator with XRE-family HTH domain
MRGRELVGMNVRRLRVAKGIAQERLAYDAGVDRSYLGGVERSEENPTVDILDRLAATLGVGLIELFIEPGADASSFASLKRGRKAGSRQV